MNQEIFGIYDPEENDFNLNMWSQKDAQNVRSSISRINKLNLSNTADCRSFFVLSSITG